MDIKLTESLTRHARDTLLNGVVGSSLFPRTLRWRAMTAAGADVRASTINDGVFVGGTDLHVGRGTFINYQCFFDCSAPITIGERVSFGPKVTVLTSSHQVGGARKRAGALTAAPVTIGDGAWIGGGATILPGVVIGPGALVAAGALVTKDVPANTLVAGVPAAVVRQLDAEEQPAS